MQRGTTKRSWVPGKQKPLALAYALAATFGAATSILVGLVLHASLPLLVVLSMATVVLALIGFAGAAKDAIGERIEADAAGVHRITHGEKKTLVEGDEGGICVLVNCARSRGVVVFSSETHTRYIGFELHGARLQDRTLILENAAICADLELEELAHSHPLQSSEVADLLTYLKIRYPHAYGRLCSRTPAGERIALSRHTIEIGEHSFDLHAPIQWKAGTFFEWMGSLTRLFQATTLRQGDRSVAFVCAMPTELSVGPDPKLVASDLALVQAPTQAAPRGQKIALERLYMLHLRTILAGAPLAELALTSLSRVRPSESRHLQ